MYQTMDDIREAFMKWLDAYHATPQSGDGMFNLSPNLAMERFRGPIRTCDPKVLDFLCCKMVGPVKVGRDGIRYNGVHYGRFNEDIVVLQTKSVWLRIDPERADFVTVCDERGVPLCVATNERLSGTSREDVRKLHQFKGRVRRTAREYLQNRQFLLDSTPAQLADIKRTAALAAEAALRKDLPAVAPPEVTIVRPDLHAAAERLAKKARVTGSKTAFDRLAEKNLAEQSKPAAQPTESVGDILRRVYGESSEIEPVKETTDFDWLAYYERNLETAPDTEVPRESDGFSRLVENERIASTS